MHKAIPWLLLFAITGCGKVNPNLLSTTLELTGEWKVMANAGSDCTYPSFSITHSETLLVMEERTEQCGDSTQTWNRMELSIQKNGALLEAGNVQVGSINALGLKYRVPLGNPTENYFYILTLEKVGAGWMYAEGIVKGQKQLPKNTILKLN